MITIKVRRNENINRVLSRFKAAVMSEGIMKAVILEYTVKIILRFGVVVKGCYIIY